MPAHRRVSFVKTCITGIDCAEDCVGDGNLCRRWHCMCGIRSASPEAKRAWHHCLGHARRARHTRASFNDSLYTVTHSPPQPQVLKPQTRASPVHHFSSGRGCFQKPKASSNDKDLKDLLGWHWTKHLICRASTAARRFVYRGGGGAWKRKIQHVHCGNRCFDGEITEIPRPAGVP